MKAKVMRDRERRFEAEARRRNALPTQCLVSGCPYKALVGGRFPAHTPRGGGWATAGRDYGSRWPKIRAGHLRLEPGCRVCGVEAVTVDHILAKAFGGGDDEENLQSLCRRHADQKNHADSVIGKKRKRGRR